MTDHRSRPFLACVLLCTGLLLSTTTGATAAQTVSHAAAGLTLQVADHWTISKNRGVIALGPRGFETHLTFRLFCLPPTATVDDCLPEIGKALAGKVSNFEPDPLRTGRGRYAGIPAFTIAGHCRVGRRHYDLTVYALFARQPAIFMNLTNIAYDISEDLLDLQLVYESLVSIDPADEPPLTTAYRNEDAGIGFYVPLGWQMVIDDGALVTGPRNGDFQLLFWSPSLEVGDPTEAAGLEVILGKALDDISFDTAPAPLMLSGMEVLQTSGSATRDGAPVAFFVTVFPARGPGQYSTAGVLLRTADPTVDLSPYFASIDTFLDNAYRIFEP